MYESSDAASIAKSSRLHRYGSTERDNGLKRRDRMSNQFTWYEGRGIYEGRGTIWSETLKSPITGRFRVTWSDKGGCRIECFGTSLSLPQSLVILQDFSEFRDLEIQCEGAVFRAARCYRVNAVESANAESEQVDLSLTTLVTGYALLNVGLLLVGILRPGWTGLLAILVTSFLMSVMFPTIFALGLKDLGPNTRIAGSFLVMAVLGGAIITPGMGLVTEHFGTAAAFQVPLYCYLGVATYGLYMA